MGKNIIKSLCIVLGIMFLSACTNLDETIYDQVESGNFYNTRKDVERVVARPFEHCYHMLQFRHFLQELPIRLSLRLAMDGGMTVADGGVITIIHGLRRMITSSFSGTVASKASVSAISA